MNYELAKKLKDAGFPQEKCYFTFVKISNGEWDLWNSTDISEFETPRTEISDVHCPTLSELIEVCGEGFETLSKDEDGWYANNYYTREQAEKQDDSILKLFHGSTPEEAVAKLWLEINKP